MKSRWDNAILTMLYPSVNGKIADSDKHIFEGVLVYQSASPEIATTVPSTRPS